jgi:hypothetical protein
LQRNLEGNRHERNVRPGDLDLGRELGHLEEVRDTLCVLQLVLSMSDMLDVPVMGEGLSMKQF